MRDSKCESCRALNRLEQIEVKQINILHNPAPAVQPLLPSSQSFAPVSSNSIGHITALVSSVSKTARTSKSSSSQLEQPLNHTSEPQEMQQKSGFHETLEIPQSSEIQQNP